MRGFAENYDGRRGAEHKCGGNNSEDFSPDAHGKFQAIVKKTGVIFSYSCVRKHFGGIYRKLNFP